MKPSPQLIPQPQLYTTDYHRWLEITIQQLRDGNLAALDSARYALQQLPWQHR